MNIKDLNQHISQGEHDKVLEFMYKNCYEGCINWLKKQKTTISKDPNDIFHDAVIVFLAKIKEGLKITDSICGFLAKIVQGKFLNLVRKEKKRSGIIIDNLPIQGAEDINIEKMMEEEALYDKLAGCIKKLPAKTQKIIDLFYFHNKSGKDIAEEMDMKQGAVRQRLLETRKKLKKCLTS